MENKDSNHFVQALLVGANKFSEQKHIMAIRDGFITLMPATIIASFWVLINNLVLGANGLLGKFAWAAKLTLIGGQVYNATLGILAILIAYTIGERLTRAYKGDDPSFGGVFGVISFFVLLPASLAVTTATGKNVTVAAIFSQNETSATGMFLAIISSLIGVTLLCKFNKIDKLRIKMPDSVPPALAKSFNVLIPAFLVSLIFGVVDFAVEVGLNTNWPDLIVKFFQAPLVGGFQSLAGILMYVFLSNFLWAFGLHGTFILGSIGEPVLLTSLQQNMDALKANAALPNIVTKPFLDAFAWCGGGGMILCLILAVLLASKREDYRTIAKVGLVPSLFNVSEPIMFGMPVVFNPILGIPLVITPLVTTTIAYFATAAGLVARTSVMTPWTTPAVISGYLATNGDWRASILQIILIAIGTLIYFPFVRFANRTKD
ncbi:MAG: PTS sugar transporter subunit IIC [Lactobacillus sp.]|jgi:PTS system cellobiose-specific IIC component|uniref:Permease IIC component n=1 Tax=Lacticaseibacillus suilingensis TaxID=2799577 RepID=A0ABW4BDJ3_9LACO|nr:MULTISPECIES: PTS sugar transporter subunit IIC [Lacticaseibacillus]MCI1893263.1 PTS sugar transporter subunit IIC [Lactobacillus sp.]MCI1918039.1 PTS sugar transporter subunit IIC [Lactobacillus sp.]MCI1940787.1 PTS sugar transporter subunit IIC [Lactobacillus sp.]MCI1971166.1 PTS sugar transporter subunit IIC [Lactobacillus sp.]MCI2016399.1 PTS sugar transporter subunit IIC [Lactobacillus sp.]